MILIGRFGHNNLVRNWIKQLYRIYILTGNLNLTKTKRGRDGEIEGGRERGREGGTEGRRDGRTEGRTDGGTDGRRDGRTEGRTEGRRDGRRDAGTESPIVIGTRMDGHTNFFLNM